MEQEAAATDNPQPQQAAPLASRKDRAISIIDKLKPSLETALPKHLTKERFARILLTQFRRIPKLCDCTQESIGGAVLTAAQLGIEIGVNGQGWIIPYKNEATLVIGYQGLVDLVYRSEKIDYLDAEVICENDEISVEKGANPRLRHVPNLRERGKAYAVYAVAKVKGAMDAVFAVLTMEEIQKIKNSSHGAEKSDSPWQKWPEEMYKKTALKRLCKLLPKSVELRDALEYESEAEERAAPVKEVEARQVNLSDIVPGNTLNHSPVDAPLVKIDANLLHPPIQEQAKKRGRPAKPAAVPIPAPEAAPAQEREPGSDDDKGEEAQRQEPPDCIRRLNSLYENHAAEIDAALKAEHFPTLSEIQWEEMSELKIEMLNRIAGKIAKGISQE